MATLIKKIGPEIPLLERYQTFTGYTEFASDDIIDVQASLGRPASETTIVCGPSDSITLRFNAVQKVFPEINDNQFQGDRGGERRLDWDNPVEVVNESQAIVTIGNNEIYTFSNPCKNIHVVTNTGSPVITVS